MCYKSLSLHSKSSPCPTLPCLLLPPLLLLLLLPFSLPLKSQLHFNAISKVIPLHCQLPTTAASLKFDFLSSCPSCDSFYSFFFYPPATPCCLCEGENCFTFAVIIQCKKRITAAPSRLQCGMRHLLKLLNSSALNQKASPTAPC